MIRLHFVSIEKQYRPLPHDIIRIFTTERVSRSHQSE